MIRGECSWSAFVDTPTVPVTGRGHRIKSPESTHVWGVALESVLDEVWTLLVDKVVVGCSIHSDLKVLGLYARRNLPQKRKI